MRLLIVEDDKTLSYRLKEAFVAEGFSVDTAHDGEVADTYVRLHNFSLIILDLGLPEKDGFRLLRSWRYNNKINTPILILTARSSWTDRVEGLNLGADDYVTKPFKLEELIARVKAVVRRSAGKGGNRVEAGALVVDNDSRQASLNEKPITLTTKEFALLQTLILNKDKTLSRQKLLEQIYDASDEVESNTLEVFIRRLRKKIGSDRIVTERGYGYRLVTKRC